MASWQRECRIINGFTIPNITFYLHAVLACSFTTAFRFPLNSCFDIPIQCVLMCVWRNPQGDPLLLPVCNPGCRLCECTEAEAEIILQLKNELREKELKLTDIRLEALSSAHHLDQIREAMNRMQVSFCSQDHTDLCFQECWNIKANLFVSAVDWDPKMVNQYLVVSTAKFIKYVTS